MSKEIFKQSFKEASVMVTWKVNKGENIYKKTKDRFMRDILHNLSKLYIAHTNFLARSINSNILICYMLLQEGGVSNR